MDEHKELRPEENGEKPGYVPASFEKRVAAWTGVVYMVMLVFATAYALFNGGPLVNCHYLLLPPAAVGGFIIGVYRIRHGKDKDGPYFNIAILFLCVIGFLLGVICGVPSLLANFGLITL